jgi:Tol biopolymer transport system component
MLPYFEGGKSYSITAWSKDGHWMAGFGRGIGLLAYEVATRRIITLAPSGRDPVWFPDNATMAYTDGPRILTANVKNARIIRTLVDASPNEIGRQISLTADGRKLYYTVVVNASDIWTGTTIAKGTDRQKQ